MGCVPPSHWPCPSLLPSPRPTQEAEAGGSKDRPARWEGWRPRAPLLDSGMVTMGVGGDGNPPTPRPAGWGL